MTDHYQNTVAGSNTPPYDTWAKGGTVVATTLAALAAGEDLYVAQDNNDSPGASISLVSPGTVTARCKMWGANRAGTVPPVSADLATTSKISTGNGAFNITYSGFLYMHGFELTAAGGASNGSHFFGGTVAHAGEIEASKLVLGTTSSAATFTLGGSSGVPYSNIWKATTVKFGAVGQSIVPTAGDFRWENTPLAIDGAGSVPTTLFIGTQLRPFNAVIEAVDLSAMGSGKKIVGALAGAQKFRFLVCKLNAAVTLADFPTHPAASVEFLRCSGGPGNAQHVWITMFGKHTDDPTVYRNGGGSDGTTPASRLYAANGSVATPATPFEMLPIDIWNDTAGTPVTVTAYGTWSGPSPPDNGAFWIDVIELGASGNPQGTLGSSGMPDRLPSTLSSPSAGVVDAVSTWTNGSTTNFKASVTFTAAQKGYISVKPKIGTSTPMWVDEKVVLS